MNNILFIGIEVHNRAILLGNVKNNVSNGFREDLGMVRGQLVISRSYDPLLPLPKFSKFHYDELVVGKNITVEHAKVI